MKDHIISKVDFGSGYRMATPDEVERIFEIHGAQAYCGPHDWVDFNSIIPRDGLVYRVPLSTPIPKKKPKL